MSGVNKALVLVAHGRAFCLTAEYEDEALRRFLDDVVEDAIDGFDLERAGVDYARACPDGLWAGDLSLEDDGPGDWPGTREAVVAFSGFRPVTAEEWASYRAGEWIWVVPGDDGGS